MLYPLPLQIIIWIGHVTFSDVALEMIVKVFNAYAVSHSGYSHHKEQYY